MVLRTPPSLTNGEAVGTLILTTVVVVEVSTHKEVVTITTTTIITTITITTIIAISRRLRLLLYPSPNLLRQKLR